MAAAVALTMHDNDDHDNHAHNNDNDNNSTDTLTQHLTQPSPPMVLLSLTIMDISPVDYTHEPGATNTTLIQPFRSTSKHTLITRNPPPFSHSHTHTPILAFASVFATLETVVNIQARLPEVTAPEVSPAGVAFIPSPQVPTSPSSPLHYVLLHVPTTFD